MNKEDSLQFVQERLRHHYRGPLTRSLGLAPARRVTRRFAVEIARGDHKVFERVDGSVRVHCTSGSVWITHDGDCKDVIMVAGESYGCDREQAMHLFPLEDCVLEIEFQDDAIEH